MSGVSWLGFAAGFDATYCLDGRNGGSTVLGRLRSADCRPECDDDKERFEKQLAKIAKANQAGRPGKSK
jgi:hypothetical protein